MSLNGFDEQAIAAAFGEDIMALRDKPSRFIRALVFIEKRREGMKDAEAKKAAMEMTMADIEEAFTAGEEDPKGSAT